MTRFSGTYPADWQQIAESTKAEAGWRCVRCGHADDRASGHVLTVHHLNGDKSDNSWYNLASLCQRCHLSIQGRVRMWRGYFLPHSSWFRPYAAGFYARQHSLPDDRQTVSEYQDELLDLGQGRITIAKFIHLAALRRNHLHQGEPLKHPRLARSVYREYVGMMGEYAFSKATNIPMNLKNLHGGDNGVDFYTGIGTIDVKTYLHANNLLRPVNMPHPADIHVLAAFDQKTDTAFLLGWAYDWVMRKQRVRDFGYGIINHYLHKTFLNDMDELYELL